MEDLKANLSKTKDGENTREWVKLGENAALYMDVQTGELSLKNPVSDTECEMYKSTSAEKVAYYCEKKGGGVKNHAPCTKLRKLEESTFSIYRFNLGTPKDPPI